MSNTDFSHLGPEHSEWLRTLDFYESEIDVLEKRLAEVETKNTSAEARTGAEHFQNQFIVQRNNIGDLKHAVRSHSHRVFEEVKDQVENEQKVIAEEHGQIEDNVKEFEKIVSELRSEFNLYLSKWM